MKTQQQIQILEEKLKKAKTISEQWKISEKIKILKLQEEFNVKRGIRSNY